MIYILLTLILIIYFYLLFKNFGEGEKIYLKGWSISFVIILFTATLFFIYLPKSNVKDIDEYEKILIKNENIRNNIFKIKENIPKLEKRMQSNPNFFEGWVMLARSYSIINNTIDSIKAYEEAIIVKSDDSKVLKEYLHLLKIDNAKNNKGKILKVYEELLRLEIKNPSILIDRLNYSVNINDSNLTIKTLEEIIDHPQIVNKKHYETILMQINSNKIR